VSLVINSKIQEPKLYTGVKYNYELDELMTFPLKQRDLTPQSRLAIEIFDMDKEDVEQVVDEYGNYKDKPIASTVFDLFDSKMRLRQGTWALLLHRDKLADIKLDSNTTSALPAGDNDAKTLNNTLKQIELFSKN